jgi:hypothetical protein
MKKIKCALLLYSLLSVFTARSQYWEPIATMPGRVQATCVDSNFYYAAYISDHDSGKVEVARWDGSSWYKYPEIKLNGNNKITKLIVYKNELYIAGSFRNVEGLQGSLDLSSRYLVKFDGTKWDSVRYGGAIYNDPFKDNYISDLDIYNNKLYATGGGILEYDGISWKEIKSEDTILNLEVNKDTLFVVGYNKHDLNIYFLNDDSLAPTSFGTQNTYPEYKRVFFYKNKLLAIVNSYRIIMLKNPYQNKTLRIYTDAYLGHCNSSTYFNNDFFIGLHIFRNDSIIELFNKTPLFAHLTNVDSFDGKLIASGGQDFQDYQNPNIISVEPFRNAGLIEANIFVDENLNCLFDNDSISSERAFDRQIEVLPGPYYLDRNYSSDSFMFSYTFPNDTYKVIIQDTYNLYKLSPCANYTRKVTIVNGIADSAINFALNEKLSNENDISVKIVSYLGWRARSGFTEYYKLICKNTGKADHNDVWVDIKVDDKLKLESYAPPDSQFMNHLFYYIPTLRSGETKKYHFQIKVPVIIPMGDTIKLYSQIKSSLNDSDLTNNYDTLFQTIVGAVDPNDKTCFPVITTNKNLKKIEYLIRFQNVGSDTAYKVVVVDTIDTEFLPLTKIVIDEVSHPYDLDIKDNILTWTFYNILLPDSTTDEPGSHGYIKYTASVKPGLKVGDTIINRAYIYFDYQKVLPTNIAMSIIVKPDISIFEKDKPDNGITLYPNPTSGEIFIKTKNDLDIKSIKVVDILGNTIISHQINGTQEIKLSELLPGQYILILNSDQRSFVKKFIVLTK